jgi:hypothetical protein
MSAVGRRLWRNDDSGSVLIVVAFLLAGGVLLGFLALVIDVGRIYAEREELVTGADAAAMAVGRACANERPECADEPAILSLVQSYANANARDGVHNVLEVCGRLAGKLSACGPGPNNLTRCLGAVPPAPAEFVEVRLSTMLPDGRLLFPPAFAQAIAGNESYDGTAVRACSRVTWERVDVLGLTVSTCEFNAAPAGGPGPYGSSDEVMTDTNDLSRPGCHNPVVDPWKEPDNSGWLDHDANCLVDLPANGVIQGDLLTGPDFQPPDACVDRLDALIASGESVWLPVHDAHQHPNSDQVTYRTVAVAEFVVTGYWFGDQAGQRSKPSTISGPLPCTSAGPRPMRCVSGVFTGESRPTYNVAGDAIVRLIG